MATHIAGWFAAHEFNVMLGDIDRQQSSLRWLSTRARTFPRIDAWGMTIFDLPAARTIKDREQWQPLMDWLMWRDLHKR